MSFLAGYIAANGLLLVGARTGALSLPSAAALETAAAWTIQGLVVGSVVTFLFWLHRVVGNMRALGTTDSIWTAGKAVGWCFVPFGFFVQPMWSVLDAWRGADASARFIVLRSLPPGRMPWVLAAWWLSWLLLACTAVVGPRAGTFAVAVNAVAGVSALVAALFCILVIREVSDRQERKHQLIVSGQLA